ncbi:type VI secretion system tube protein TssD [Aquimarina longa]|uniref:type VI secretion system tube protein TssD n=1 Tax=Aquimarina longa TaxID=1080221 RepID=UPI0007818DC0|nr:type VI secretion system tube protein TssD [Aquimarina longa]
MSIKVTLYVDDKKFRVLDFFFGFFQNSDYTGRPSNKSNVYPFKFTIEASKDATFYEWAIHPAMQKQQAKIVFSPVNGISKSTTIELLDVHCLYCNYHFTATGSQPFVVNFDLSPATIIRNGKVMLKRYWAVTDPAMLNMQPTEHQSEDNEPRIIEHYITDREDIELGEYARGQEIYCVLISENMDNATVDVDLSKFEVPLLYRGERLQDNIIKKYTISADEEKIPLQVISEDHEDEQ